MSSITEEKKFGISSCLSVQCNICRNINKISTSEQHRSGKRGPKAYDANSRVALAAIIIDNGLGFSHVNSILTALDIPSMTRKTYKIREHEVGKIAEEVAKDLCKEMLDQECSVAKRNGAVVGDDGLLPLSVSYDMGWSKRGRPHNSLTGHGAVMGSLTGKALDYMTKNKLCRTCLSAKKDGCSPNPHNCRLNHKMSSKSMEPESAVELFRRAPVQGSVAAKYVVFIGDDDCLTMSCIKEEVAYAKRTLLNHLYKLKSEKSFPHGESALSNKVIEFLGKCFSYAVAQNAGNVDGLQQSIKLIIPHAFGNHENCKEWCGYKTQGSTSPLARSPKASKTGAGLVNFARSVVRGLVEIL